MHAAWIWSIRIFALFFAMAYVLDGSSIAIIIYSLIPLTFLLDRKVWPRLLAPASMLPLLLISWMAPRDISLVWVDLICPVILYLVCLQRYARSDFLAGDLIIGIICLQLILQSAVIERILDGGSALIVLTSLTIVSFVLQRHNEIQAAVFRLLLGSGWLLVSAIVFQDHKLIVICCLVVFALLIVKGIWTLSQLREPSFGSAFALDQLPFELRFQARNAIEYRMIWGNRVAILRKYHDAIADYFENVGEPLDHEMSFRYRGARIYRWVSSTGKDYYFTFSRKD